MNHFLGVDPGIRGGAGIAMLDEDCRLVFVDRIRQDPQASTLQTMAAIRDAVKALIESSYRPAAVAREEHIFPGSIEVKARIILRRMNGILDMAFYDAGYHAKGRLWQFPVNSWKAIVGMPGDLGKDHLGSEPGQMPSASRRHNTETRYLAAINSYLGHEHDNIDTADAHGVAKAAWTLDGLLAGRIRITSLPENSQRAVWDQTRAGGMTLSRALKRGPEIVGRPDALAKCLRTFCS